MIISSLHLKDFGIFYGSQSLALTAGLYVIHGRNGRGKTTFLNAVRWALYGRYTDSLGRIVPSELTLNRQARREGQTEFLVELTLRDGSDEYFLRRRQFVSASGPAPSQLYMERNSQPLTMAERDRTVQRLLSEQVSQFFLFDGEQLQRYETLLTNEDTASQLIRQSIEQILGLPVLDNGLQDLGAIRDELNKRLARQARQIQQLEQLGARAEQAQADLDSKRSDIQHLRTQEVSQYAVVSERDKFLQKYENSLEQLNKLESLDEKVRALGEQRQSLAAHRADELREVWRDVLAVALKPTIDELTRKVEQQQQTVLLRITRTSLEAALASGECTLCGQDLDVEHQRHIADEISRQARLEAELEPGDPEELARLPVLTSIVNTGHADAAIKLDGEIGRIDSDAMSLRQDIEKLREALQNLPESDVTTAQKERDLAHQELGRLRSALEQAQREEAEIDERLRRAQEEIRKAGDGGGQHGDLTRSIDLAEDLGRVFEVAKGRFRDELRTAVEASATDVFKQLTNEPEFERLDINDSYGLEIVDSRGETVQGRSRGQEQIVALSLIAALNRNARRGAPVIMDTPFGRLDPEHRSNILRFLSRLADQVFLLVHGGEVNDADLAGIGGDIQEQLELQRDDIDRTTLVPRSVR